MWFFRITGNTKSKGQVHRNYRPFYSNVKTDAPVFILAISFAGFAKASGNDAHIARVFSGKSWATTVAASLAGALSPFCSCGVIPLIAAMLASGVPLAPVMAFCISSPIMDPDVYYHSIRN
jgi:uncharacterized membrane protein YraQ (UPF0718 family)